MESWSASGLQQVGSRLRRSLCSGRRNPASDLLGPSRGFFCKHRSCDIKGLALAHALGAKRPCVSSELGPAALHTKDSVGLPTCWGDQGY